MKILLLSFSLFLTLNAVTLNDTQLKKMIGCMLIIGFGEKEINTDSQIVRDIQKYDLGGVILFDRDFQDRNNSRSRLIFR